MVEKYGDDSSDNGKAYFISYVEVFEYVNGVLIALSYSVGVRRSSEWLAENSRERFGNVPKCFK